MSLVWKVQKTIYQIMEGFNRGMALEYKFAGAVLQSNLAQYAKCNDKCPKAVEGSRIRSERYDLRCTKYVIQENIQYPIEGLNNKWTLIKLIENHPSLDFLIVAKSYGRDSHKLFLIQVSTSRYETRDNEKNLVASRISSKNF